MGEENMVGELNTQDRLFEILEHDKHGNVISVKKISTGEIFKKGGEFYHLKYNKWISGIRFDDFLVGTNSRIGGWYKNYIRTNSGVYHLDEITLGSEFL